MFLLATGRIDELQWSLAFIPPTTAGLPIDGLWFKSKLFDEKFTPAAFPDVTESTL